MERNAPLIGIAGRIGAGKSHVAGLLQQRGWRVLDMDQVGHQALEELSGEIEKRLGPGLLDGKGTVVRSRLADCVFSDSQKLKDLEELTYPWIEAESRRWITEDPETPAALHAVNLHKTEIQNELDAVIWVKASRRVRKKRVIRRDGRPWRELKSRFRAQRGLKPKLFSTDAEIYSVRNSGNRRTLESDLKKVLHRLAETRCPGRGK